MKILKRYLITGLVVLIPIFLSIYILVIIFRFMDNILGRFINTYLHKTLGFYIPGLGIFIFFLIILSVGFFTSHFIGRKIFPHFEKWFSQLPLIKNFYSTIKQIVLFILVQKEFGFKKVVLVEYPSKGIWSLGFLTNEEFQKINRVSGKDLISVFLPSTPGPLTGYVVFVPKAELKFPDISVKDALKIVISGGVFKPE